MTSNLSNLNETEFLIIKENYYLFGVFFRKTLYAVFMAFISLMAFFGNTCAIIAMFRDKRLRTISNMFILSLCISDLMVGFFVMPLSATIIVLEKWIWGFYICRAWLSIDYIASTASIFNLFVLSLERYWSIVEPLKYIAHKSKSKANLTILIVWLISSLWVIPINFWNFNVKLFLVDLFKKPIYTHLDSRNLNETEVEELKCFTDFETNKLFKIISTVFNFYLPLFGMVIIYSQIFITIKQRFKSELLNSKNFKSESNYQINDGADRKQSSMRLLQNSESNMSSAKQVLTGSTINGDEEFNKTSELNEMFTIKSHEGDNLLKTKAESSLYTNLKLSENGVDRLNKTSDERIEMPLSNSNYELSRKVTSSSINSRCDSEIKKPVKKLMFEKNPSIISYNRRNGITQYNMSKNRKRGQSGNLGNISPLEKGINFNRFSTNFFLKLLNKKDDARIFSVRLKQQIKAAKQLGILLLAFLVLWLPYFIIFIVVAFCSNCVPESMNNLSVWLGYMNSAINPLLYPLCHSGFKQSFRKMFKMSPNEKRRKKMIIKLINYSNK